jgi:putative heme-binding domain-containing protein
MAVARRRTTTRRRLLCGGLLAAAVSAVGFGGRSLAQVDDHTYAAADIQAGFRIYSGQCQLCHGPNGDQIAGVNLARQKFKRAVSDEDIKATVTGGVPSAGMPAFRFQPNELNAVVAFIRSGFDTSATPFKLGDAARGRAVFEGKGGCTACHRPQGEGRLNAPSLAEVGASRQPAEIQRYLLEPDKAMLAINRRATITLKDGRRLEGRRLNEDTFSVQLRDEGQRLHSISKADIRSYELARTSAMPSYAGKLSESELSDLMAYLVSLKGN